MVSSMGFNSSNGNAWEICRSNAGASPFSAYRGYGIARRLKQMIENFVKQRTCSVRIGAGSLCDGICCLHPWTGLGKIRT